MKTQDLKLLVNVKNLRLLLKLLQSVQLKHRETRTSVTQNIVKYETSIEITNDKIQSANNKQWTVQLKLSAQKVIAS